MLSPWFSKSTLCANVDSSSLGLAQIFPSVVDFLPLWSPKGLSMASASTETEIGASGVFHPGDSLGCTSGESAFCGWGHAILTVAGVGPSGLWCCSGAPFYFPLLLLLRWFGPLQRLNYGSLRLMKHSHPLARPLALFFASQIGMWCAIK